MGFGAVFPGKSGNGRGGGASPHPEDQVDVGVLPDVELVVGREPDPALGVVEGEEAVAERGDSCRECHKSHLSWGEKKKTKKLHPFPPRFPKKTLGKKTKQTLLIKPLENPWKKPCGIHWETAEVGEFQLG